MERNASAPEQESLQASSETDIEGADVTCWGRLFQVRAAATGKARSPTVDSRVRRLSAMMRKWSVAVSGSRNRPSTGAHRRGKTVSYREWFIACRRKFTDNSWRKAHIKLRPRLKAITWRYTWLLHVFRVHITKRLFSEKNTTNLSCGIKIAVICIDILALLWTDYLFFVLLLVKYRS